MNRIRACGARRRGPLDLHRGAQVQHPVRLEEATRRLRLVGYDETLLPSLYRFMQDPVAMRFTHVSASIEDCGARLARFEAQRQSHGYAPWCVVRKDTEEAVGWGGLAIDPEEPNWGIEVLYAFSAQSWGQGFATELVDFALRFAFNALGEPRVSAFAMPENLASIRVLEKCGFSARRYVPELKRVHFVADRVPAA